MQKIQIFVGPMESGKTFRAREITKGYETVWINGFRTNPFDHPTLLSVVGKETKYIVVEDIYGAENLKFWFLELREEKLIISRNTDAPLAIDRPEIILICYSSIAKVVNLDEYQEEFEIKEFTKKHIQMEKKYYFKITRENKPSNSIEKQLLRELQMDERQVINRKALDFLKGYIQKWIEDIESQNKRCKPGMIKPQWTSSADKKDEFCYVGDLCTISFYLIEEKEVKDENN
jgi:hypothetical protein